MKLKSIIKPKEINPIYIYLFVLALPFSWASIAIGSVYRVLTIALFLCFIFFSRLKIGVNLQNISLLRIWIVYIVYCSLTTIWAVNVNAAINNTMSYILLSFIVIIFFSTKLNDLSSQNKLDFCWIIAGVLCAILYIMGDKTAIGDYGSRTSMIIMGTATDPNEFASIFIVPMALSMYRILYLKKSIKKFMYIFLILVSAYCILLSGSRGALIAAIVSVIVTYFKNRSINIKTVLLTCIIILLIYFVLIELIFPLIPEDVLSRMTLQTLLEDGGSGRSEIWSEALYKVWHGSLFRMIFGYGQYGLTADFTQTMHNQFLQHLTNYGLIGLFLYCLLLMKTFFVINRRCPRYIGAFLGIIVMSMTITMSIAYKLLWIILLIPVLFECKRSEGK